MKIDWWTLGLQTVNVLVLLWVLQRFLFKPVQAIIAQRQQIVQKQTEEAALAQQKAEQERLAFEAERNALASGRETTLTAARMEARQARDAILAQATQEAAQRGAAAQEALTRERAEAETALQNLAGKLAADMTRRLLERLPAMALNGSFIDAACDELAGMEAAERQLLLQADGRDAMHVVTAVALDPETKSTLQRKLNAALGEEVAIAFSCDPALLAGVELRFRHIVIRNNLAADLAKIMEQLNHDDDTARVA